MRRANNQDSYAVVLSNDMESWRRQGHFFMVADGMGAHAAGELASKLAVDGVQHRYHKYLDLSPPERLYAFLRCNFAQLQRSCGGVFGTKIPHPRLIPLDSLEPIRID